MATGHFSTNRGKLLIAQGAWDDDASTLIRVALLKVQGTWPVPLFSESGTTATCSGITSSHASLADKFLHIQADASPVGAGLPAIRASPQACPQATNRLLRPLSSRAAQGLSWRFRGCSIQR